MKHLIKTYIIIVIVLSNKISYSQNIDPNYEVGKWSGFKQGAVSFTFDDGCSNQFAIAMPMFNKYGFKMTFFTVTGWSPNWTTLQTAADSGHEIADHTISHGHLGTLTPDQLNTEYKNSQSLIESHIKGQKCVTLAYPYCETAIDTICQKYFIAARGCSGAVEPGTPSKFTNISSIICGSLGSVKTAQDFKNKANMAASSKGWVVFLIHGIDNDGGYSPVSSAELRGALDSLNSYKDKYWVNSFGNVARYIKERNCVKVKELTSTDSTFTCTVNDTLDFSVFNYPLSTRRLLPPGWSDAAVFKNGNELNSKIVEANNKKYIMFDVVPDSDEVSIVKKNITGVSYRPDSKPLTPYLNQNFPNPFNPVTRIDYRIVNNGYVTLKVYDVLGKEITTLVDGFTPSGRYTVNFDGSNLPSGFYFYTLKAGDFTSTKKLILLK